ncbi:MAG: hypothetical protein LAO22_04525 [Acidobacteriia bacterium]|nr:hypothetical protein [Terriglobia bacterium]
MTPLWEAADFIRRVRRRLLYGELSRAPLRLLRLELRGDVAECEWIARPPDPWDADLPPGVAERNQTLQALRDAMKIRDIMFEMLSEIRSAKFRVYRQSAAEAAELIITGTVAREDQPPPRVSSVAMRAKLCGFHFSLEDGVLKALPPKDRSFGFAT